MVMAPSSPEQVFYLCGTCRYGTAAWRDDPYTDLWGVKVHPCPRCGTAMTVVATAGPMLAPEGYTKQLHEDPERRERRGVSRRSTKPAHGN